MFSILIVGILSFALSFGLTPLIRDLFVRLGYVDRPDHDRKLHVLAVPRVGGIPIMLAFMGSVAILFLLPLQGGRVVSEAMPQVWKFFPAVLTIFAVGLLDDLIGLKPWQKLAGEIAAAGMACFGGLHLTLHGSQFQTWLNIPLTIFWLILCTNAFNLIDGVDGLAAGVGLFATITSLGAGLLQQSFPLALATVPLAGALLGFLRYNFSPATIFLGDSGSLSIGFLLGCYGIVWVQKSATMLGLVAPVIALSLPLLDTVLAVARRLLRGQHIFSGDRRHIHHLLLDRGLRPRDVVLLLYAAAGFAAILSLLQNELQHHFPGLVIVLFCLATWIAIQHLGYIEFGMAGRMILPRALQKLLQAQLGLRALEESLAAAASAEQCWTLVRNAAQEMGFTRVSMRLSGKTYDDALPGQAKGGWTLDIPLSPDDCIVIGREFNTPLEPMVVAPLADLLRRTLAPKLPAFCAQAADPAPLSADDQRPLPV
jgi:UDP-GlcNAc:undecaprenyl-phosphate GlcNAc-1-phosphate transferase